MNNPLKKIKLKILKDYTTDEVFRETQKKYDEKIKGLSDRIDQLSRIIEHTSGNTVNFYLDWSLVNTFFMLPDKKIYTLYIYKGTSEFPIILKELSYENVDEKSYVFALEDNIARFEVTAKRISMDVRYVFLIDYENKTYIVKSKTEIDLSKSKEKEEQES
ncbi:hypothetical protein MT487_01640 [Lachnospiraceae bacterium NSJ-171]|nr:hypothetical protein [Lachnospiraceae bacterium NSJ-171]